MAAQAAALVSHIRLSYQGAPLTPRAFLFVPVCLFPVLTPSVGCTPDRAVATLIPLLPLPPPPDTFTEWLQVVCAEQEPGSLASRPLPGEGKRSMPDVDSGGQRIATARHVPDSFLPRHLEHRDLPLRCSPWKHLSEEAERPPEPCPSGPGTPPSGFWCGAGGSSETGPRRIRQKTR